MTLIVVVVVAVMGTRSSLVVVGMNVAPSLSTPTPTPTPSAGGGEGEVVEKSSSSKCCDFYYQSKWDAFNKCVTDSGATPSCNPSSNTIITNTEGIHINYYKI